MPFRNAHVLFTLLGSMALVVVLTLLERDSLDTRRVFVRKMWMHHVDVTVHSGGRGRLPLIRRDSGEFRRRPFVDAGQRGRRGSPSC